MQPNQMTPQEWRAHHIQVSGDNINAARDLKNTSHKLMDNILFVVSTGTFVVSGTFISFLQDQIFYPWLLIISWICLILAVAFNFRMHMYVVKQSMRSIELINTWRSKGFPEHETFHVKLANDEEINKILKKGNMLSHWSIGMLSLGLVLIFLFTSINLMSQKAIRDDRFNKKQAEDKVMDEINRKRLENIDIQNAQQDRLNTNLESIGNKLNTLINEVKKDKIQ